MQDNILEMLEIIDGIDKSNYNQFTNSRKNKLYSSTFIYTLPEYKDYIKTQLQLIYNSQPITNDISTIIDIWFQKQIKTNYLPKIYSLLENYNSIPCIEQKTEEWLAERRQIITASEAGYLLGIKGRATIMNYLSAKLNISTSQDKLRYMPSVQHGTIFEDVSRMIYETRNNVSVREYGLIKSVKTPFLGASPDGIVSTDATNARIGRLVEIKNPYKFDETDDIKPEYLIQIYQQQYVLGLPLCDFIKTNIIGANASTDTIDKGFCPYKTLDDLLADIPGRDLVLYNTNIPANNLTARGMEKGVLISYKATMGDIKSLVYPLTIEYEKDAITKWIIQQRAQLVSSGINKESIVVQYWYVARYSQQTVEYDAEIFEKNYLPRLELIQKIIDKLKLEQSRYDKNVFTKFMETQIKPLFNKPSKFYKDVEQFNANCLLLQDILKLQPNDVDVITKSVEIDTKTEIKTEMKKGNTKVPKSRVIIELDF